MPLEITSRRLHNTPINSPPLDLLAPTLASSRHRRTPPPSPSTPKKGPHFFAPLTERLKSVRHYFSDFHFLQGRGFASERAEYITLRQRDAGSVLGLFFFRGCCGGISRTNDTENEIGFWVYASAQSRNKPGK